MDIKLYKGVFWLRPEGYGEFTVISKKARCLPSGEVIENTVEFSSKSGENFNHKAEWAKLPQSVTQGHAYNYYPRGRVEIKNGIARLYMNPDINVNDIRVLVLRDFGISKENRLSEIKFISDGSEDYGYEADLGLMYCNMCGKCLTAWHVSETYAFESYIAFGSKREGSRIKARLCPDCFDKTLDWILPQCKIDPMTEQN